MQGILPAVPGFSTGELSVPKSNISNRIDGYDVARAIAIIGMIFVNYHSIFLHNKGGPQWFVDLAYFHCGRAGVLFVILTGISIALMSNRQMLAGDKTGIKKIQTNLMARSLVLFSMGLLLRFWWRSDILHFYGIFLMICSCFLNVNKRTLIITSLSMFVIGWTIFCIMKGDPDILAYIGISGPLLVEIEDVMIYGNYAIFPWLGFILFGIWIVREGIISNPELQWRVMAWSIVIFLLAEAINFIFSNFTIVPQTEIQEYAFTFFQSNPFPVSPLFSISAAAGDLSIICAALLITHYGKFPKLTGLLRNTGKVSLSIYVFHIFIGSSVQGLLNSSVTIDMYPFFSLIFVFSFCMLVIFFPSIWFKYYSRGPLEWLMRRLSNSL